MIFIKTDIKSLNHLLGLFLLLGFFAFSGQSVHAQPGFSKPIQTEQIHEHNQSKKKIAAFEITTLLDYSIFDFAAFRFLLIQLENHIRTCLDQQAQHCFIFAKLALILISFHSPRTALVAPFIIHIG